MLKFPDSLSFYLSEGGNTTYVIKSYVKDASFVCRDDAGNGDSITAVKERLSGDHIIRETFQVKTGNFFIYYNELALKLNPKSNPLSGTCRSCALNRQLK